MQEFPFFFNVVGGGCTAAKGPKQRDCQRTCHFVQCSVEDTGQDVGTGRGQASW